jgi:hypothetical protein
MSCVSFRSPAAWRPGKVGPAGPLTRSMRPAHTESIRSSRSGSLQPRGPAQRLEVAALQAIAAPPGREVSSAPSRCLGRCQAGDMHPSVLHETRRCPRPPAQVHGSQLRVIVPGCQAWPFRHSSARAARTTAALAGLTIATAIGLLAWRKRRTPPPWTVPEAGTRPSAPAPRTESHSGTARPAASDPPPPPRTRHGRRRRRAHRPPGQHATRHREGEAVLTVIVVAVIVYAAFPPGRRAHTPPLPQGARPAPELLLEQRPRAARLGAASRRLPGGSPPMSCGR